MALPHFVYPVASCWTFGLFDFFIFSDNVNHGAMNIFVKVFVWTYVFISFAYICRTRIAGSYGKFMFSF